MKVWRWYRGLRLWLRVVIGIVVVPVVLSALYIGVRGVQYLAAEKDAGAYIPASANVTVRLHDLEGHWERIQQTPAWQAVERRILRDPAFRRRLNALLAKTPLPTLNALDDERRQDLFTEETLMLAAGRDVAVAAHVGDTWSSARVLGCTRLPFKLYLVTPFAGLALKSEKRKGVTMYAIKSGGRDAFVSIRGALAVGSTDAELLVQALGRRRKSSVSERPVEAKIDFASSLALLDLRRTIRETGLLPHVDFDTAAALEVRGDVERGGMILDTTLVGAEPLQLDPAPPHELLKYAPANSTGHLVTSAGARDIYDWLRFLVVSSPNSALGKNARIALDTLDEKGLKEILLPRLGQGMAVFTGRAERGGRTYPAMAVLFAAPDPIAARDALHEMVQKIAGTQSGVKMQREPVENSELISWEWPGAFSLFDFLQPCYANVEGAVILGNDVPFMRSIIRTAAGREGGFADSDRVRAAQRGLLGYRYSEAPAYAGGFFLPPLIRESLDGLLPIVADQVVDTNTDRPALRRQIEEELRQLGRLSPTDEEIVKRFNAALARKRDEEEQALHREFAVLSEVRWVAFESSRVPKGMSLRAVVQLTDRRR